MRAQICFLFINDLNIYTERSRVDRNFPPVFKEGEPNLLLVSKGIFLLS